MGAIEKFDYVITRRRAKRLLRKLNWNLREEDVLIDDMVQNAALEVLRQDDPSRFNFIIGHAMMDVLLEWRFNVKPNSHRTRRNRGQQDDDQVYYDEMSSVLAKNPSKAYTGDELNFSGLDLTNFKLHQFSLDPVKVVMAKQCIEKLLSGNIEPPSRNHKADIGQRREACKHILLNGAAYTRNDDKSTRKFTRNVLQRVNRVIKDVIRDHIEVV